MLHASLSPRLEEVAARESELLCIMPFIKGKRNGSPIKKVRISISKIIDIVLRLICFLEELKYVK